MTIENKNIIRSGVLLAEGAGLLMIGGNRCQTTGERIRHDTIIAYPSAAPEVLSEVKQVVDEFRSQTEKQVVEKFNSETEMNVKTESLTISVPIDVAARLNWAHSIQDHEIDQARKREEMRVNMLNDSVAFDLIPPGVKVGSLFRDIGLALSGLAIASVGWRNLIQIASRPSST